MSSAHMMCKMSWELSATVPSGFPPEWLFSPMESEYPVGNLLGDCEVKLG